MTNDREPPYDGKPCPMCPIEIRNLHAVAHNFLNRWDAWRQHGGDFGAVVEKARDLERAVQLAKPLADAHFADRAHSHPAP